MLRIRIFPSWIPYLGSKRFRIPDPHPHRRIQIFLALKTVTKLWEKLSRMFIPDLDFFHHPGSRGQKSTGSRISNTAPRPVPLKALVLETGILAVAADPTVGPQTEGAVFLLAEAQPGTNYAARHPDSAASRRSNSASRRPDPGDRCRDSVACRRCLSNFFSIDRLVCRVHTLHSEIM
jgi:hypothetical protein